MKYNCKLLGAWPSMSRQSKPARACRNCGKGLVWYQTKYCSNQCQADLQYKEYVREWKVGEASGLKADEAVSDHVRRYLSEKYRERCCQCGWQERHPRTGQVP
jgi:hypothetical protein